MARRISLYEGGQAICCLRASMQFSVYWFEGFHDLNAMYSHTHMFISLCMAWVIVKWEGTMGDCKLGGCARRCCYKSVRLFRHLITNNHQQNHNNSVRRIS